MPTAEPFMPAHESPAPKPGTEHDLDHDVDVLLEDASADAPDGAVLDPEAPAPPFRAPVPGEHLSREDLLEDLGGADDVEDHAEG
ncbi:hypothetical protein ABZ477_12270 [Microbacterium sp. NPDC019599]|uniref:hypothetical protein n=1 Tax=Microbacterium sp. NPDC019599 TaxID=3154690 RepID=UPI0033CA83A1